MFNRAFFVYFPYQLLCLKIFYLCVFACVFLRPTNVCVTLIKSLDFLQDSFTGTWNQRIYYVRGRSSLRSQTSVWRERFAPVLPTQTTCPPDGQFSPSMYNMMPVNDKPPSFSRCRYEGEKCRWSLVLTAVDPPLLGGHYPLWWQVPISIVMVTGPNIHCLLCFHFLVLGIHLSSSGWGRGIKGTMPLRPGRNKC